MITRWGQNAKIELSGRDSALTHSRYAGYAPDACCHDDDAGLQKEYIEMAFHPVLTYSPLRSDDELQQITVGAWQPHNAPIDLAEYDPEWPRLFTREADRLREVLGDLALRVEHVGSTRARPAGQADHRHLCSSCPTPLTRPPTCPGLEAAGYRAAHP